MFLSGMESMIQLLSALSLLLLFWLAIQYFYNFVYERSQILAIVLLRIA